MSVLAIARLTLMEAVKRRLLLTGTIVGLAFVALVVAAFWFLGARADTSDGVLSAVASTFVTVFGLYTVYFMTGLVAVFLAAGAISGDVQSGVLQAVLARPLSRAQYVLGRWAGLAALVAVYVCVMAGALLAAAWLLAGYAALDPVATVALLVLQATVLASLALLGSTLLPTVANAVAVLTLFGLAWLAGIVGTIGRSIDNDGMVVMANVVSVVVPSDAIWRAASYFAQSPLLRSAGEVPGIPFASATAPPVAVIAWGLAYPVAALGLSALVFSRRDL